MQTATNPDTGERVFFNSLSQQWEPLKTATNPDTGERVAWDGSQWIEHDERHWRRKVEDKATEYGQTGLALGSGAVGGLAGFVGGLGSTLFGADYDEANEIQGNIQDFLTYEPTDSVAQGNMAAIAGLLDNDLINGIGQAGEWAGDTVNEGLSSNEYTDFAAPTLGFLAQAGPELLLGAGAGKVAGSTVRGAKRFKQEQVDPRVQARKEQKAAEAAQKAREEKVAAGLLGEMDAGSAQVGPARQRIETAEGLPIPLAGERGLTQGQAMKDTDAGARQWTREEELRKLDGGTALSERKLAQRQGILANLENVRDQFDDGVNVGDTKEAWGAAMKEQLQKAKEKADADKDALYTQAEELGDMSDLIPVDEIGVAFKELIDNGYGVGAGKGKLKNMTELAQHRGVLSGKATIGQIEEFRKDIGRHTDFMNDGDLRGTLIAGVDRVLNQSGAAPAYQKARGAYAANKRQFEETGVNRDILGNKRKMQDPRVPTERVYDRVRQGSLQDIKNFKETIQRAEGGAELWTAFKQKVLQDIIDESRDSNDMINHNRLRRQIKSMDDSGKLEELFGDQAQTLRDISEVADTIGVEPFQAFVNHSNSGTKMDRFLEGFGNSKWGRRASQMPGITKGLKLYGDRRIKKETNKALNARGLLDE